MRIKNFAKRVYCLAKYAFSFIGRNRYCLDKSKILHKRVKLEWVDNGNLGDSLGVIIYTWMLKKNSISENSPANKSYHLLTCGSLIGVGNFDAVVWGSGTHTINNIVNLLSYKNVRNYDIRAVRGPITRRILIDTGYSCPEVYGDPAILMPLIYNIDNVEKKYDASVILHYYVKKEDWLNNKDVHYINIATTDYKTFVQEILASKKVISSSLHGIILAESYGVPTVFLNTGGYVDKALMKYYDWYYSTNRWKVKMAKTIDEAVRMSPMSLPQLDKMRTDIMSAFPYDLWKTDKE